MLLTKIQTILRINNQVIKIKLIWWFSVGDDAVSQSLRKTTASKVVWQE